MCIRDRTMPLTAGDTEGNFTFYDSQGGASSIDIAVASDDLKELIKSFVVCQQSEYSHHSKVVLRIKNLKPDLNKGSQEKSDYQWIPLGRRYIWNDASIAGFVEAFNLPQSQDLIEECKQSLDAGLVEAASSTIDKIFTQAADLSLRSKGDTPTNANQHPYKHKAKWKKWFDVECREQKITTRRLGAVKRNNPKDLTSRQRHTDALKEYKKLCTKKKLAFQQAQASHLDQLLNNSTDFWKQWKKCGDSITSKGLSKDVDGKKWEDYFTKLYSSSIADTEATIPAETRNSPDNRYLNAP